MRFLDTALIFTVLVREGFSGEQHAINFAVDPVLYEDAFAPINAEAATTPWEMDAVRKRFDARQRAIQAISDHFALALSKHMEGRAK